MAQNNTTNATDDVKPTILHYFLGCECAPAAKLAASGSRGDGPVFATSDMSPGGGGGPVSATSDLGFRFRQFLILVELWHRLSIGIRHNCLNHYQPTQSIRSCPSAMTMKHIFYGM
ncbi:hypothetical protein E3N88_28253 [Mikania micrantha]|uniref:Uncharacterized protein n=1 Tax=Mikania micrantha TaxID=192012 RepID=A0A5N6N1Y8_9ASTR|nr:hypothetical protein E3N88_28253 [Mikania micrantha]